MDYQSYESELFPENEVVVEKEVSIRIPNKDDLLELTNMQNSMNRDILNIMDSDELWSNKCKDSYFNIVDEDFIYDILYSMFIIEKDGNVVGFAQFKTQDVNLHIMQMYVKDEYRRQGISNKSLKLIEDYAISKNLKCLSISCIKSNKPALESYEKSGYREYHVSLIKNL